MNSSELLSGSIPGFTIAGGMSPTKACTPSLIPLLRSLFVESGVESPEDYSSHSTRRGFAGRARTSGWDIKELMEYVGCKDVKSARRDLEASHSNMQARFEQGLPALVRAPPQPPEDLRPPVDGWPSPAILEDRSRSDDAETARRRRLPIPRPHPHPLPQCR